MNSCNFTGRLTRMPEVQKTNSGMSVCRFRLAVRRTYKTNGEYLTDFLDFVAWDEKAELVGRYFGQGQLIAVKSSAQLRSYENKRGDRINAVEFVVSEVESLVPKTQKEEAAEQGTGDEIGFTTPQSLRDSSPDKGSRDVELPQSRQRRDSSLGEGAYAVPYGNGDGQDDFLDIGDQDLPF